MIRILRNEIDEQSENGGKRTALRSFNVITVLKFVLKSQKGENLFTRLNEISIYVFVFVWCKSTDTKNTNI